tara:strand:+ start:33144 stop:33863 length:720 start_codon:yes stop_codon:yes gene_type:complete
MKYSLSDRDSASRFAADMIAAAVRDNPEIVLGLATGETPIGTYRHLIRLHRDEGLDFSGVTTFNLDEYIGLGRDHPQSFHAFMRQNFFDHVNISADRIHLPDGLATDPVAYADAYEDAIRDAGGIDLQLLGIGHNGHIAFNEPGSPADSRTRVVDLTADTIEKNARFFDSVDDVPKTALSMGIGTILDAKRIVLLAFGAAKAEAVLKAMEGPVTVDHPASLLQTHDDVTFILDAAAAEV